jgi:hypothetical protein
MVNDTESREVYSNGIYIHAICCRRMQLVSCLVLMLEGNPTIVEIIDRMKSQIRLELRLRLGSRGGELHKQIATHKGNISSLSVCMQLKSISIQLVYPGSLENSPNGKSSGHLENPFPRLKSQNSSGNLIFSGGELLFCRSWISSRARLIGPQKSGLRTTTIFLIDYCSRSADPHVNWSSSSALPHDYPGCAPTTCSYCDLRAPRSTLHGHSPHSTLLSYR